MYFIRLVFNKVYPDNVYQNYSPENRETVTFITQKDDERHLTTCLRSYQNVTKVTELQGITLYLATLKNGANGIDLPEMI
jgi:hypothetical protein